MIKVDQAVKKMMMCQQRKSAVARMVWTQSDPVPLLGEYGSGNACTVDVRFFSCRDVGVSFIRNGDEATPALLSFEKKDGVVVSGLEFRERNGGE